MMEIRGYLLIIILLFFAATLGVVIYNESNMEHKYTIELRCYDKYGSVMKNMTCSREVYCGPWQRYSISGGKSLPCNDALVSGEEQ